MKKKPTLTVFLLFLVHLSYAQIQSSIPINAYGVWERGDIIANDPGNPAYDFLKGFRMDREWSEIQPNNANDYDWTAFKDMVQIAVERDKYIYTNILVGPQCPNWIYDDVPLVKADGDAFNKYPYYLDEDYKAYYFALIENYAALLRDSISDEQRKRILFVQVMTGCTGDECAYKGSLLEGYEQYDITEAQWRTFRLEAFEKFKTEFLDGDPNTKINLVFNNIDPAIDGESEEWNWVIDNIGTGFGIKGSAYVRGHHLTFEKTFKDQWYQYLVNPETLALFSRAEMDQTYTWPLYQNNLPLGFYWGALSGLNTGLSIWDLTNTAVDAVTEKGFYDSEVQQGIMEAYDFFNKYAPQVYPSASSCAYSIFHEGLNSANTAKFPESIYGDALKGNVSRYINICNAYADRGALMEHPEAATYGQVWQRHNQIGYNDAGWEIPEGNYERWIEQINPDQTSIGLFRINADSEGKLDANNSKYDRFARSFEHLTGKNAMYFKFHDDVFSASDPKKVTFTITWFDKTSNSSWEFRYDAGGETLTTAKIFTGTGSGQWKKETIVVTDAIMRKNGPKGSDFALVNTDEADDIFHGIEADIVRIDDDKVFIESPQNGAEFAIGNAVVVTAVGEDVHGIERMRFSIDNSNIFNDDFLPPYIHTFNDLNLGEHIIDVQMKDSLGYLVNAEPVTIIVVPANDTVFIELPENNSIVLLGEDVTISAFGYDADGIANLKFRVNEGDYNTVDSEPYQYTFTGLGEGSHYFDVQMTDLLANNIMSEGITITVLNKPDSVSIITPSDGDTITQGKDVLVTTYCHDNDGIERIRFRLDNSANWDNVLSPPYQYTYRGLSVGTHLIEVQMKDVLENRILAEPVHIIVIAPPIADSVSITSPSNGDTFSLGEDLLVKSSCYDRDGIATVGFRADGGGFNYVDTPPYEFTFSGLGEGTHTLDVQMTDLQGNTILSQEVDIYVVDQSPNSAFNAKDLIGEKLQVYPTMVDKELYWKSNTEVKKIHITNLYGKRILSQEVHNQGSILLSELDPGLYFVCFEFDKHLTRVQKIIKK